MLTFDRHSDESDCVLLNSLVGKVNDMVWKGHEAKTVLFVGSTIKMVSSDKWFADLCFRPDTASELTGINEDGSSVSFTVYESADFTQLEPLVQTVRQEEIIKGDPLEDGSVIEYCMNVYSMPECKFLRAEPVRTRIVGAK